MQSWIILLIIIAANIIILSFIEGWALGRALSRARLAPSQRAPTCHQRQERHHHHHHQGRHHRHHHSILGKTNKTFSFGHCPNYLPPPPWLSSAKPYGSNWNGLWRPHIWGSEVHLYLYFHFVFWILYLYLVSDIYFVFYIFVLNDVHNNPQEGNALWN